MTKKQRKEWSQEEIQFVKDNINTMTYDDLAIILDRNKCNICRKCKSIGIKKTKQAHSKIKPVKPKYKFTHQDHQKAIEANKLKAKNGLHPRGYLGHIHSEETRKELSQCSKKGWSTMTKEKLDLWKEHQRQTRIQNNTLNPIKNKENAYSRTKGGKRKDLNNQYFRSAWEANIARYFNYINVKWEYEPKTFVFKDITRGSVSYTPDFYLTEEDKWIEVKGWMDGKSKTKLCRFKKQYPEEYKKLILITEKEYKEIKKKLAAFIKNWE